MINFPKKNQKKIEKSKIYLFNPTNDLAVANGIKTYTPPNYFKTFEKEAASLPFCYAESNDIIISPPFSDQYVERLGKVNFTVPRTITKEEFQTTSFSDSSIHSLEPWGWSPAIHLFFQNHVHIPEIRPLEWHEETKHYYSRAFAKEILESFLAKHKQGYISSDKLPFIAKSITDLQATLEKWESCVCKLPWSSSGRGVLFLRKNYIDERTKQWFEGGLKKMGYCMIEPVFNKKLDFSLQFKIDQNQSISFLGYTVFETENNGQYLQSFINPHNTLKNNNYFQVIKDQLDDLQKGLIETIGNSLLPSNFQGVFGIDCMVVEDNNNNLLIHPCLEINLRYNMGYVALMLEKKVSPEAKGIFSIESSKHIYPRYQEMQQKHPITMNGAKMENGFIALNDVKKDFCYLCYASLI